MDPLAAAGMPWYAWAAVVVIVLGVGYRIYSSRKNRTTGGPSGTRKPGGPRKEIP